MAVLSNNGRLISSLPIAPSITGTDELLIQSNGVTRRIQYTNISSSLFSSLSSYAGLVTLSNTNNKFTGSFYNPTGKASNLYTVQVRDTLTVNGKITGNLTGSVYDTNLSKFMDVYIQQELTASDAKLIKANITDGKMVSVEIDDSPIGGTTPNTIVGTTITASTGFAGNITSTGTSTFSSIDVNGGVIDGTVIGASSAAAVTGTTITANTGFVGNLTGDVYNSTSTKVLESGNTTPTINGGVSSAFFYGTSSYATQALTAAYAAAGVGNGLPAGGSTYQVLAKTSNSDYQVTWTNPITASTVGVVDYVAVWDGARTLKNLNNFSYYGGTWNFSVPVSVGGRLTSQGITVGELQGGITSSFVGYSDSVNVSAGSEYKKIRGDRYSSVKLKLSASAYCTMSLLKGQTTTVFVHNSGKFKVLKWSGSLDGGSTANTKVYWKNGLSASITMATGSKDIITFTNIDDKIFGSAINNFQ